MRPQSATPTPTNTGTEVDAHPAPDLVNRQPDREAVDHEGTGTGAGTAVLINAGGCSLLLALVVVMTRIRGFLAFRWYALAALWLGVTIGFVLGSSASTASLASRVDTQQRATDSPARPTAEARVAVVSKQRRLSS